MKLSEQIRQLSEGARFVRADLHIHSYGDRASFDVRDTQMTPQNIIDTSIKNGLEVISITDHNAIGNVGEAIDYADGKPILVVPGIEVSTVQGHLLVYLPDLKSLEQFHSGLSIADNRETVDNTIPQCLDLAESLGGFGVCAHVDIDSGFLKTIPKIGPAMKNVVSHKALLGLEFSSSSNSMWLSREDENKERGALLTERIQRLNLERDFDFARIQNSDAHKLDKLGQNAAGQDRLTRIKMDELSFESFRIAFLDANARIRLEDTIPHRVPRFVGVKYHGGFLDGQITRFSPNLTCIIGGRGAGKSTILESLRATSGNRAKESLVDNEVWPDIISLIYEDETGLEYELQRSKSGEVMNVSDPDGGIVKVEIESIGQGDATETIQFSDKDPSSLLGFMDDFIDVDSQKVEDDEVRELLLANQDRLDNLSRHVERIPLVKKQLVQAHAQLTQLKREKVKDIVELEHSLVKESSFRKDLIDRLKDMISGIHDALDDRTPFDLLNSLDSSDVIIGVDEFAKVKGLIKEYEKEVDTLSKDLETQGKSIIKALKTELTSWKQKESSTNDKVQALKAKLQEQGIPTDLSLIKKVAKDYEDCSNSLKELQQKKKKLLEIEGERKELLARRSETLRSIFLHRREFAKAMNKNLKNTVLDYEVSLKFYEGRFSNELRDLIKTLMNYKSVQVPKADILVRELGYAELLECLKGNEFKPIVDIQDSSGSAVFSTGEAKNLIETLSKTENLHRIQRIPIHDRPEILVTKLVKDEHGKTQRRTKSFARLSLGQQQSILLTIMLFSKRNCPLVIDQPEDNLDSEFIYKTIVQNLRRIKEHRQVILVTHNANIAVLGDAELILPLKSTNDRTHIVHAGSIDNSYTKRETCDILEGGNHAFNKRKTIYNLK